MTEIVYEFEKLSFRKYNGYIFQIVSGRTLSSVYHAHDFYEWIWFVRGTGVQQINGEEVTCAENELFLIRPGEKHCFTAQSEQMMIAALSVKRAELERLADWYHPRLKEVISRSLCPIRCDFRYAELADIGREGWNAADCKFLLSCFLKNYMDGMDCPSQESGIPRALLYAAEEMHKTEHLKRGIPAFVEISHYSRSHLSRLVKRYFHKSLKQYINELRLQKAYSELLLTDRSVQDIAEEAGFFGFSHFQKIFKARFGETPASLRKRGGMRTV